VVERFCSPGVGGFLHRPEIASGDAVVLAHGAGSDCRSPLLVAVAEAFARAGFVAVRIDLPFRQARAKGPPYPADAAKDRQGLRAAAEAIRPLAAKKLVLGGHSYGGRQATILAAEDPTVADQLLLLSYPLHPPKQPHQLRTGHFPNLQIPAVFLHGTRDPFGTIEEIEAAISLIPAATELVPIARASHSLGSAAADAAIRVLTSS
jgi:predicted alpha/beta-hydrolase family hydrolase